MRSVFQKVSTIFNNQGSSVGQSCCAAKYCTKWDIMFIKSCTYLFTLNETPNFGLEFFTQIKHDIQASFWFKMILTPFKTQRH